MTRESNATPELNFQNEIVPDRCSKFTMVHIYLEHLRTSWINGACNKGQNGGWRINVLLVNEVDWWSLLNYVNMLNYKPTDVYSNQYCTNVVAWNSSSQVHHCSQNTVRTLRSNCRDTHRYTQVSTNSWDFDCCLAVLNPKGNRNGLGSIQCPKSNKRQVERWNGGAVEPHLATPFSTTHNWYLGGRFDLFLPSQVLEVPSSIRRILWIWPFSGYNWWCPGISWDFIWFYGILWWFLGIFVVGVVTNGSQGLPWD